MQVEIIAASGNTARLSEAQGTVTFALENDVMELTIPEAKVLSTALNELVNTKENN